MMLDFWNEEMEVGIEITTPVLMPLKVTLPGCIGKNYTISKVVGLIRLLCDICDKDFYESEYPPMILEEMKAEKIRSNWMFIEEPYDMSTIYCITPKDENDGGEPHEP